MKTQIADSNDMVGSAVIRRSMARKLLLACGVLSSLLYVVANDIIAAMRIPGYSRISQPISELSATYAPSRPVLVPLIVLYEVLLIAFGAGVWQSAQGKRLLRVASGLIMAFGVVGLVSFPFPMTQRGLSDTMHIITMGILTPLLIFVSIGFGAGALGERFPPLLDPDARRVYLERRLCRHGDCSGSRGGTRILVRTCRADTFRDVAAVGSGAGNRPPAPPTGTNWDLKIKRRAEDDKHANSRRVALRESHGTGIPAGAHAWRS